MEKANLNSGQNRVDIHLMLHTEPTSIPFMVISVTFHIIRKNNYWFRSGGVRRAH